ncbi:DUF6353 family protein [Ruminococcus sp. 1001275B_160808_F8]|jgi:hypothetical protein|uniref:DUF6353 family protein n=1 Tax=unclassified Ruminococcus TaxID=2608920 RepID=UPI0018AB7777|nr:DUF6353 family protein [Ruminococcus sp. 1001275B_160808_F8]
MNKTIIFDEKSCQWSKNELVNAWTLGAYECRLNDHLQTRGYLLLRDVYEALGIPITKESLIAWWVRAKIHEQFRFEIYTKTNGVMEAVLPDMELDIRYALPSEEES